MIDASKESGLGKGGLLGSDQGRRSAGSESRLGSGSLLGSDARRVGASAEIAQAIHQQSIARQPSKVGKVTVDNGDGTYTVELAAGGGTYTGVTADPGAFVLRDSWVSLDASGPGWKISGPATYSAG